MADHKDHGAPAPKADERLGGKHLADDALLPLAQRTASRMLRHLKDEGSLGPLIRLLQTGPGTVAKEAIPSILNVVLAKKATSSEAAHFARDFFVHLFNELAEVSDDGDEHKKVEKVTAAHENAWNAAMGAKYAYVAGSVHKLNCPNIAPYRKHSPRPQRKGKDDHSPPVPQGSGFEEVTMEQILNPQNPLRGAWCCFEGVQADFKKEEAAKHPASAAKKGPLSAMDVIGAAKPEERKKLFDAIAAITDADRRARVAKLLRHLDSKEEMTALLNIIDSFPEMPEDVLTLLENSNSKLKFSEFLSGFGQSLMRAADGTILCAKDIGVRIGDGLAEFDKSLAPTVRKLERWNQEEPRKRSFLGALFGII